MKEINIHSGHVLMTIALMLFTTSIAIILGDATLADAWRIMLSCVGTIALLIILTTFK